MAWIEQTPSRSARRWRDDATGQIYVSALCGVPLSYEGTPGSGQYDTLVNFTPQRVTSGGNDGWRITANQFHYFLGQPSGRATDGWVGFGGRQGQHWLSFRLLRAGYLHWNTRTWDDVGGSPTYTRTGRLTRTNVSRTMGPEGAQSAQVLENVARWTGIWSTPGGGDVTIRWRVNGRGLKEEIVLNEAARNWIAANRPPTTPASETWFGFIFQMDWSDIPRVLRGGLLQSIEDDFDDTGGIRLETALNELLAFMPLDHAVVRYTHANGHNARAWLPLRKRIYKDGDDYLLLVGARVDQLNALPAGDIVFDPTFDIAETAEDGMSEFGATGTQRQYISPASATYGNFYLGYDESSDGFVGPWEGGWIYRSTGIPQGATIDTASISLDNATNDNGNLPINGAWWGFDVDSPTDFSVQNERISDHHTRTTATVTDNIDTGDPHTSPSLVSILQEIVDRAGYGGDIGLTWRSSAVSADGWYEWSDYTDSASLAADLTVTYTAGGGQTVTPGFIDQSPQVFAPTVTPGSVTLAPGLIDQTPQVFNPTLTPGSVTLSPGLIDQTPQVFAPTITTGAVTVSPGLIDQTPQVFNPTITTGAVTVTLGLIDQTPTVFAPTANLSITPGFIDQTPQVFAPTLTTGSVTVEPGLIDLSPQIFAPQLNLEIEPGFIDQTPQVFAPTLAVGSVTIEPGLIDQTPQVFNPTVAIGAQFISLGLIDQTPQIFNPTITPGSVTVSLGLIDQTPQVFNPTVTPGAVTITVGLIDQSPTVFSLTANLEIKLGFIDQNPTIYAPTLIVGSVTVTLGLIDQSPTVYAPIITGGETGLTGSPTREAFTFNLFTAPFEFDASETPILLTLEEVMAFNAFQSPFEFDASEEPFIMRLS